MADQLTQGESFALTALLSTPTDLHDLWIARDEQNLRTHMKFLGFSDSGINVAVIRMREAGVEAGVDTYNAAFNSIVTALKKNPASGGIFPEYSDGTAHPAANAAQVFVTRLLHE